jgi:hypothetical protein
MGVLDIRLSQNVACPKLPLIDIDPENRKNMKKTKKVTTSLPSPDVRVYVNFLEGRETDD